MANLTSGFFQTLVAETVKASEVLAPTWNASQRIFWDYKPTEIGSIGQTINVLIPNDPSNQVADSGVGDLQITDVGFSQKSIAFNKHPQFAYTIRDFEQFNSPEIIRRVFVDAAFKAIKNYINASVANLFTTANFTTNSAIACTASIPTLTQFTGALAVLADQRVPVEDNPEEMTMLLPSVPYYAVQDASSTGGTAWTQAFIAGARTAEAVRQTGVMPVAFGTTFKLDQQMPITGSGTAHTYTGCLFHKYAVAGVSRPMAAPDTAVQFERVQFGDIELRVMMQYNLFPKQGWIVSIDAGYGLQVVRDNMGVLFTIAQ